MDKIQNKPVDFGTVTMDYQATLAKLLGLDMGASAEEIVKKLEAVYDSIMQKFDQKNQVLTEFGSTPCGLIFTALSVKYELLSQRLNRLRVSGDPTQDTVNRKLGISDAAFARHN